MKRRIIYSNNTVLEDFSSSLADYYAQTKTFSFVALEDKFFISSSVPFNSFYVKAGDTVNAEASVMSIKTWDGSDFNAVAEVIDETSVSGASLGQSGFITFTPDKNEGWFRDDTQSSSGDERVTGLGDVNIYDQYWIEVTFSADLTADVDLTWIGDLFSDDNDLGSEFPDLVRSNTLDGFETGKTDWEEQHHVAAKTIIKDLKRKHVLHDGNQILDREDLRLASTQKVASIIFNSFGDDYLDQYSASETEYIKRINSAFVKVDLNSNAREDVNEDRYTQGRLYR